MPERQTSGDQRVRTAEIIGAACLATDLGMGFPFEHGLHGTLVSCRLADALEVDSDTAVETFYTSLLMYSGCTTDAESHNRIFGGGFTEHVTHLQFGSSPQMLGGIVRALPNPDAGPIRSTLQAAIRLPQAARFREPHFTALCEVAVMLAERLGLPSSVSRLFTLLTERWDGKSLLRRASGEDIPLPLRIVHVARDAALQHLIGGSSHAAAVVAERGGRAFDPEVAAVFARSAGEFLQPDDDGESVWEAVMAAEPQPQLMLDASGVDRALWAIGDFADLVSPAFAGHSPGVADLARRAAGQIGLSADEVTRVGRAALVHDVGRVAIHPRIWQKRGKLTADEWEQVRLHAYHTERVLYRSELLGSLVGVAGAHHERVDGSGYHRGSDASSLEPGARLVAAADAYHAMNEPRPHRPAFADGEAASVLSEEARAGRHDPDMVAAVLRAAGEQAPKLERPAGLTEREAEVIGLLARGLQTKQVARQLDISPKTADRHIQNAYRKIGVSTRAAATLFATEHGLVTWGELRI